MDGAKGPGTGLDEKYKCMYDEYRGAMMYVSNVLRSSQCPD